MSEKFRALRVEQSAAGFTCRIQQRDISDLGEGDVLIRVLWSSLNYKDALSASGNKGVTRRFPHTPGIDVAGVVERATDGPWKPGDKVIVTGYDLGMNTDGGFGEFVSVPAEWVVRCPLGLTLRSSMILGTAGLTAALCVSSLIDAGIDEEGAVLVTGASGGVGSVAVALLSQLGYRVTAATGRESSADWLKSLGASKCISRQTLLENSAKPMLAPKWSGVVDAVGGEILAAAIKGLRYGASATCCGMAASADLPLNVFPFILRGVNLLGVDSVELPVELKQQVWDLLGTDWSLNKMADLVAAELSLEELPAYFPQILAGQVRGRAIVKVAEE